METVGFVGVGKIGLPISQNLIKSGYRVVGYRRSSLAEFEKIGGVAARSAADVGAQADIVFSCLPSDEALEEVMQGPRGLVQAARPGQIVTHHGTLADAPSFYDSFDRRADGVIKAILRP